jgi:hypothetical protein
MASFYQPVNYLRGGKRKTRSHKGHKGHKGGFYPSIMGGVMSAGKLLIAASLRQGYKMLTSKSSSRSKKNKSRKVRISKNVVT